MAKENPSDVIRAQDVRLFDRWALPSFDAEGAAAEESVEAEPIVE